MTRKVKVFPDRYVDSVLQLEKATRTRILRVKPLVASAP